MGSNATLLPPDDAAAVERFDHVALAVHEIAAVIPLLDMLGARYHDGGHHTSGGFRWVQFVVAGDMKLELLSPLSPADTDNFLVRFLATRGEGPHHVTFKVQDLTASMKAFSTAGYRIVGEDRTDENWFEAFVHPKTTNGLLIQLAEWDEQSLELPTMPLDAVLAAP